MHRVMPSNGHISGTRLIVNIPAKTNHLIARKLGLEEEQLDDFWLENFGAAALCILDGCEVRLRAVAERRAVSVLPACQPTKVCREKQCASLVQKK